MMSANNQLVAPDQWSGTLEASEMRWAAPFTFLKPLKKLTLMRIFAKYYGEFLNYVKQEKAP